MAKIPHWLILGGTLFSVFLVSLVAGQIGPDKLLSIAGVTLNPDQRSSIPTLSPNPTTKPKVTSTVTPNYDLVTPSVSPISVPVTSVSPITTAVPTINPVIGENPTVLPSITMLPHLETVPPTPRNSLSKVVINEIAWMGTKASAEDEWLELYNPASDPVVLDGWHLSAADGSPNIVLKGNIASNGYYLIERTDDQTVSDIPANLTIGFGRGLSNDGEDLSLADANGNVVDRVNAAAGWFAGNNTSKASMERLSGAMDGSLKTSWATSAASVILGHDAKGNSILGTPGAPNSQ